MSRIVSWFSCGVASAVATKMAINLHGDVTVYNIEVMEEHPDNRRFLAECEEWFNMPITVVGNDEYHRSIYEVFSRTGYLVGPKGARCTGELKRAVRWEHGRPDDRVILGYTAEEGHRVERLKSSEPWVDFYPILHEHGVTKQDCHNVIAGVGIEPPAMYRLGYNNANCIGCVKGQAGYWNKIREDFPDVFERMAKMERELGRTICKREWMEDGERKLERVYLDELPPDLGRMAGPVLPDCGFFCEEESESILGNES